MNICPICIWQRAWRFALANPKSSLAGLAAIAASLFPGHTAQISSIAAGIGLILSADAK
jgi:hypothetical protein